MSFFARHLFAFAIMVSIPLSAEAEIIYMVDGSILKGTIKTAKEAEIVITTEFGDISINNTKILKIRFSDANTLEPVVINTNTEPEAERRDNRSFFQTPTPWFILAGLQLGAGLWLSSAYDDLDNDNAEFKKRYPNYIYEKQDRSLVYLDYGLAAVWAIMGISRIQVTPTTSVGLSTSDRTTFMVMNYRF